jgi:hypothetical protein
MIRIVLSQQIVARYSTLLLCVGYGAPLKMSLRLDIKVATCAFKLYQCRESCVYGKGSHFKIAPRTRIRPSWHYLVRNAAARLLVASDDSWITRLMSGL